MHFSIAPLHQFFVVVVVGNRYSYCHIPPDTLYSYTFHSFVFRVYFFSHVRILVILKGKRCSIHIYSIYVIWETFPNITRLIWWSLIAEKGLNYIYIVFNLLLQVVIYILVLNAFVLNHQN